MTRRTFGVGVVSLLAACNAEQQVDPAQFIPQHKPVVVSVWVRSESATVVSDPSVRNDTLHGTVFDAPWAASLKDIEKVEAAAPSPARTGLLVAAMLSGAAALYFMADGHGTAKPPCDPVIGCNSVKTAP